jgi:hypothetical protein
LPHLAHLRHLSLVLALRASAHLEMGRGNEAFHDAKLLFDLAETIRLEPFLISSLVRIACLQNGIQVLWEGLQGHQWSEPQLREWQSRLRALDLLEDNVRALNGERFAAQWLFDLLRTNRRTPADSEPILDWDNSLQGPARLLLWIYPRGWAYMEQLNYDRLVRAFHLAAIDPKSRRAYVGVVRKNEQELENLFRGGLKAVLRRNYFAATFLPALSGVHVRTAAAQSAIDQAVIACALERYRLANGRFPDSLDALAPEFLEVIPHDIITGEPLKYRRNPDGGFILYSVGWNETDDGGSSIMPAPDQTGDWVWHYPAR